MGYEEESLADANAKANQLFGRMSKMVAEASRSATVDVLDCARRSGLEIDEKVLEEIGVPRHCHPHPFLPWYVWYPWRPLWCWWWKRYYPWYRVHPWWWYRCHRCGCCC